MSHSEPKNSEDKWPLSTCETCHPSQVEVELPGGAKDTFNFTTPTLNIAYDVHKFDGLSFSDSGMFRWAWTCSPSKSVKL